MLALPQLHSWEQSVVGPDGRMLVCVWGGGGVSTLHLPDGQQSSLPKVTGLGRPGYLEALWR